MSRDLLERTLGPAIRDQQTVTPDGVEIAPLLDGMSIHRSPTHTDDRGTLTEIVDARWEWHPDPLVYAYYLTERPGHAKGWALHKEHQDRYYLIRGELELVLYDVRPDSATNGNLCRLVLATVITSSSTSLPSSGTRRRTSAPRTHRGQLPDHAVRPRRPGQVPTAARHTADPVLVRRHARLVARVRPRRAADEPALQRPAADTRPCRRRRIRDRVGPRSD